MREIITIQAGEFANYIGSHFWNFQDELLGLIEDPNSDPIFKNNKMDMDVLYRTGQTHQGVWTYCPRVLSIGSKGSFGTLNSSGNLYGNLSKSDQSVLTWKGGITKSIEKPLEKNLFLQSLSQESSSNPNLPSNPNSSNPNPNSQNPQIEEREMVESLEKNVKYWSDFSKVQFHPKSLYELNNNWRTDLQNLNNFGVGKEIISEGNQLEEINERLRFFIEECDHIQGIKYIVDDSGQFSAISCTFLENISDDYAKIPILLYSAKNPNSYEYKRNNIKTLIEESLHDSISVAKLSSFCDLMIPIGIPSLSDIYSPYLEINGSNLFQSSSIYASALYSINTPFYSSPNFDKSFTIGSLDFREFVDLLAGNKRMNKIGVLDFMMPAGNLNGERNIWDGFRALTPEIGNDSEDLYASEALVFNGAFNAGQNRASISQINETLTLKQNPKFSHLSISLSPLPIPLSFPSIFSPQIGRIGETLISSQTLISPETLKKGPIEVESVPIGTRIRSSIAIKPFLENRKNNMFKYGIMRGAKGLGFMKDWGFGKEEVEEMGENLAKMIRVFDSEFEDDNESD